VAKTCGAWLPHFDRTPTPFFYILTGAHAVHLVGGSCSALRRREFPASIVPIEQSGLWWRSRPGTGHFMGIRGCIFFALLQFGDESGGTTPRINP